MITVTVHINGIDALRRRFKEAPALTLRYLASATKASIFEVEKNVTEGGIMRFKTPRSKRSGLLVSTFGLDRVFKQGGLRGSTGPTRTYAPYVYFGTRWMRPNKYMDRIAEAANPAIQKHFDTAVQKIVNSIAK